MGLAHERNTVGDGRDGATVPVQRIPAIGGICARKILTSANPALFRNQAT
jgi:hypothetical protein